MKEQGIPPWDGGELSWRIRHLSLPYEYVCARRIGQRYGITPQHLARNRESVAGLMPLIRESSDKARLELLAGSPRDTEGKLESERRRALRSSSESIHTSMRDRILARAIRDLIGERQHVVTVLGWEHLLISVPGTVASILHDFDPVRLLVVGGALHWII